MVIVTHIWQKLNHIGREETLIVTNFWQLFSRIFGEASLLVTHIWPNHTRFFFSMRHDILFLDTMSTSWSSETTAHSERRGNYGSRSIILHTAEKIVPVYSWEAFDRKTLHCAIHLSTIYRHCRGSKWAWWNPPRLPILPAFPLLCADLRIRECLHL